MAKYLNYEHLPIKKKEEKHPLCLGNGIDQCDYFSTVECTECKFNGASKKGSEGKDPRAKSNRLIK